MKIVRVECHFSQHGRLYEPLGKVITVHELQDGLPAGSMLRRRRSGSVRVDAQGSTAGATAKGGIDWFEAGRLHTGDILWTEDWFGIPSLPHPLPARAHARHYAQMSST